MEDIHTKDTEKAMHKFANWWEDIDNLVRCEFSESYSEFINEVEGLLSEYKDKLDKIEELEEKIVELED